MKKQLALSAIVLTIALAGDLWQSNAATACPYARNTTTTPTIQNSPNSTFPLAIKQSHSKMMFGIATTVGLLVTGWVVASRLSHVSLTSAEQDGFAGSSLPISPEA